MFTSWLPSWLTGCLVGWMDGCHRQSISNVWNVQGLCGFPSGCDCNCRFSILIPHTYTHTHTHTASANPLVSQQVVKLVSQSLRLASCSAGISMRISRTKSKHAESRQAGKDRCEAGFICTKWLCKWDSLLTSECVNIIMARARPMQTGRTARTRGRATCCACVCLCLRGVLQFG